MLSLKPAYRGDWARLFAWRNDPLTRERSIVTEPIKPEEHMAWLASTLSNPDVRLRVAYDTDHGSPVGSVRVDLVAAKKRKQQGQVGEISIMVDARWRGRGYGARMIDAIIRELRDESLGGFIAHIKVDNYASLRAFVQCGFHPTAFTSSNITLERKR